jgi:hypothetical protein
MKSHVEKSCNCMENIEMGIKQEAVNTLTGIKTDIYDLWF